MSCYFMVDTYIDKHSESGLYEEYPLLYLKE